MNLENVPAGWQQYVTTYTNADAQLWLAQALSTLMRAGPKSQHGAVFVVQRSVQVRIKEFAWWQQGMGIRWAADGAIEMRADRVSWRDDVKAHLLPGLMHEAKHLEQGKRTALSQLGEVQAWFTEFEVRRELGLDRGHIPEAVIAWGMNPTVENFHAARQAIITQQTRRYLFWLLPKYAYRGGYEANFARLP